MIIFFRFTKFLLTFFLMTSFSMLSLFSNIGLEGGVAVAQEEEEKKYKNVETRKRESVGKTCGSALDKVRGEKGPIFLAQAAEEAAQQPAKIQLEAPAVEKFETVYYELDREFLANVSDSRKVMQIKLAIMTHYDEQVIANIEKHVFAVRSEVLDIMRQVTENDLVSPDFRTNLAENIRIAMNATLEEAEDFGGIEKVYFVEFIVQ